MRIVTNQGSNLLPSVAAHYDVDLVPSEIWVDGIPHDTLEIGLDQVEQWVEAGGAYPRLLGTSASELAKYFIDAAKHDPEVLFIASSRKLISTYDCALTAARTLAQDRRYAGVDVRVVDTGMTDVGAALAVLVAAEARLAGESLDQIETRVAAFANSGRMAVYVASLRGLIEGGRASFLRGWVADLLRVRPLLAFDAGELRAVAKISTSADEIAVLADWLCSGVGTRRVWVGISDGNDPERAQRLLDALGRQVEIEYVYRVPTSPSTYLHTSAGSIIGTVFPAPVGVETPPNFSPPGLRAESASVGRS